MCQEQPLLLEDLLEQEKRDQERQAASAAVISNDTPNNQQSVQGGSLMSDHDFSNVLTTNTPQGVPAQGLLPLQQQTNGGQMVVSQHSVAIRQKFLARGGVGQQQWRSNISLPLHQQLANNTNSVGTAPIPIPEPTMIRKEG